MAEQIIEQIKMETQVWKLTAFAALGIGGGTVWLMLGEPTPWRLFFVGIGFLCTAGAVRFLWQQTRTIRARILTIPEEQV